MTSLQLLIILVAALLHASWNIASKYGASAGYMFTFAYNLFSCIFYLPWALYLFSTEHVDINLKIILFLLLVAVLHLIYGLSLIKAYQKANLSVVYPVARGSGPLITSVVAVIVLNEYLDIFELWGILAICLGVLLIAIRDKFSNLLSDSRALVGVRWGLFIGCIIASYSVVDAYTVKKLLIAPVIVGWVSSLGGLFILLPKIVNDRGILKENMGGKWVYAAYVGLASPLAYILILYVLQSGVNLSIVAPLRESSMVFATLGGIWLFKEKVTLFGWIGCLVILSGVLIIAY